MHDKLTRLRISKGPVGCERFTRDSYEGQGFLPRVGQKFFLLYDDPDDDLRCLRLSTSTVIDVERFDGFWLIVTESGSMYKIQQLPEDDDGVSD